MPASSRRAFMSASLAVIDYAALLLSGMLAIWIRSTMGGMPALYFLDMAPAFDAGVYPRLAPLLLLFLIVYASRGLYPTIGLNRVDELRQLTISTSLVAGLYATVLFFSQRGLIYSRFVFALFWLIALFVVPAIRVLIRKALAWTPLWGVPVGVVGSGPRTAWTASFLAGHPNLGLKPAIVFDGEAERNDLPDTPAMLPLADLEKKQSEALLRGLDTLVVVQGETPEPILNALVRDVNCALPRIVMMPDLPEVGSIWVRPIDLGGVLALKIRNNLANRRERYTKRLLDLALGLFLSLTALPVMLLIAVAIKLESHAPIFYAHPRIGYGGRMFTCWKFRTMVKDADEKLQDHLDQQPELRREWAANQKLKNDPRVTRVGAWLRKLSLDELPQLWNVLRGDMSLVGPRPIVDAETQHYQAAIGLYESVRPGITGLWQVSGRNDVGYQARVSLDSYYVRNWSVWMDLYILARTPIAVFSREGAY